MHGMLFIVVGWYINISVVIMDVFIGFWMMCGVRCVSCAVQCVGRGMYCVLFIIHCGFCIMLIGLP